MSSAANDSIRHEEEVLVIPRALFEQIGLVQGLRVEKAKEALEKFLEPGQNQFMRRSLAEDDPAFKQLIPYAIFRHAGRILQYTRGKGGGEARLHAKRSIGIGGHINPLDASAGDISMDHAAYERALRREIAEELEIRQPYTHRVAALLNDDETDVGRVHLGVVHMIDLESAEIKAKETDILDLAFEAPDELRKNREHFETWSQICIHHLDQLGVA